MNGSLAYVVTTLGCLVGNYVTGFYLIPTLTVNAIALATAGLLALTAVGALGVKGNPSPGPSPAGGGEKAVRAGFE